MVIANGGIVWKAPSVLIFAPSSGSPATKPRQAASDAEVATGLMCRIGGEVQGDIIWVRMRFHRFTSPREGRSLTDPTVDYEAGGIQ